MSIYIIINSILLLVFFLIVIYLFYRLKQLKELQTKETGKNELTNITDLDWKVKTLLVFALLIIIFSFGAPFIFTRFAITKDFNFSLTGQIGDTIGGLMNPFIALSGVIVTGLAFYIQYKANLLQRELFIIEQTENKNQLQEQLDNQDKQIEIQQFESRFYEMLKLHRENITEMIISGYNFKNIETGLESYEKSTSGRKIFVTMKTEFECILEFYEKYVNLIDKKGFNKCYYLFFSGLDSYKDKYSSDVKFIKELGLARYQHEHSDYSITDNNERKTYDNVKLYFNYKPFSGHASRLGHYFRHLYLIVKSVANSDLINDYDNKMNYLRVLRAQLSNHEQILLFYNWLSDYGHDWENENHSFFTEYKMIHNLGYDSLFVNSFIEKQVNYLRNKETKLRQGTMFEID